MTGFSKTKRGLLAYTEDYDLAAQIAAAPKLVRDIVEQRTFKPEGSVDVEFNTKLLLDTIMVVIKDYCV